MYGLVDPGEVAVHVAEVLLHAGADRRNAGRLELAGGLEEGAHRVLKGRQLPLQRSERLDAGAPGGLGENLLLAGLQPILGRLRDREVAVHKGVHQGVEDEARPVP